MNHKKFDRQLSAYVDGEMDEQQRESMRLHIEGCALCRRRMAEHESISHQLRAAATVTLPDNFVMSVRSAIRRQESDSVAWLGPERFARNVVVALCVFLLAMLVFESYLVPQQTIGVDRYFNAEVADSAAQTVIGSQQELSKADVLMAALTK